MGILVRAWGAQGFSTHEWWEHLDDPVLGVLTGVLVWLMIGYCGRRKAERRAAKVARLHAEAVVADEELRQAVRERFQAPDSAPEPPRLHGVPPGRSQD